jgi:hypothetical protein
VALGSIEDWLCSLTTGQDYGAALLGDGESGFDVCYRRGFRSFIENAERGILVCPGTRSGYCLLTKTHAELKIICGRLTTLELVSLSQERFRLAMI